MATPACAPTSPASWQTCCSPASSPAAGNPWGSAPAAVHPGMVRSQWGRSGPAAVRAVVNSPLRLVMRSPERGADTIVWLATTTPGQDWATGGYFANRRPATPSPLAGDAQLAEQLWDRSMSMSGLHSHEDRAAH